MDRDRGSGPSRLYPSAGERLRELGYDERQLTLQYATANAMRERSELVAVLSRRWADAIGPEDRVRFLAIAARVLPGLKRDAALASLDDLPLVTLIGVHAAMARAAGPFPIRNMPGRVDSPGSNEP